MARKFTKTHNDLKWLFPVARTCFKEIMLNDKAKVRDVHKYLVAVHHVTVERMEEAFKKHLEEIRKLQS